MKPEEIAQWVIDNRYPKSEHEKIGDAEMYHSIIEKINQVLLLGAVSGSVCCHKPLIEFKTYGYDECIECGKTYRRQTDH